MRIIVALLFNLTLAVGFAQAQEETAVSAPSKIEVRVTHRVFTSFVDTVLVDIGEEFWVGDTDFSAIVHQLNLDFGIKEGGVIIERSNTPHNPAFQIRILENNEQVDEVWAFLGNDAPHYRRDSLLGFQVLSFTWQGHRLEQSVPRESE